MTLDEIIRSLEDQAKDRDSSVDEDDPECIFRKDAQALREAASVLRAVERQAPEMALEELLKAKQRGKLWELRAKLSDVLDHEPADSGDEEEDYIWKQANDLKDALDDFFEEDMRGNN